jgi:Protein of unknown function (DUF3179)
VSRVLTPLLLAAAALLAACDGQRAQRDPFATPPPRALAPDEVARVYASLESGDDALARALEDLTARGDHRFVAVLIEALRASQIGLLDGRHYNAKVVALERLSGQRFGADWFAWVRWYQETSLGSPPGFDAYKGRILGRADPELATFFADGAPRRARSEEILWSGAPVEPGDTPAPGHEDAESAGLHPGEPVVGVALGGEARAYPLRWLDWHEVANDRLGGRPVAVVWCGFCASATAFAAEGGAAEPRSFAASGLLQRGVRLMYDRETHTLWNELTGLPTLGAAATEGARLEPLPALLTTWGAWLARNPETTVLALGAAERAGGPVSPYARYHASDETVFPVAVARTELGAKAQVYGLADGFDAPAWPLDVLVARGVVNAEVDGRELVLVATRGRIELEAAEPERGRIRFSPGAEVRAYARPVGAFRPGSAPDELLDPEGRSWRAGDAELLGPGGARAPRLPGTVSYWFAWQAFHPDARLGEGLE